MSGVFEDGAAIDLLDPDHAVRDRRQLGLVRDEDDLREGELVEELSHSDHLLGREPVRGLVEQDRVEVQAAHRPHDLGERQPERER